MKMSIKDISKITGYSPATVSNALNHKKGVNKETAKEILRVAAEGGYISSNIIKKIKFVIFRRNGCIIDDNPFFSSIVTGIEQECRRFSYEMVINNLDKRDDEYESQVREIINDTECGIILLATEMQDGDLEIYKESMAPILILDYWDEKMEFNGVLINNADSARMATDYLIDKGHKNVGYIKGSYRIKGFRSRFVGYRTSMQKHGLKVNPEFIFEVGTSINEAYGDMIKILESKCDIPTAFFVEDDLIALGAIKALQEKGYKVPDDVSVIGFDDIVFSEMSGLTTIRVPNTEMGKLAVRRMVDMIENRDDTVVKTQVCTKFIERDTVKKV
ncbi:MAG: LacI family DNA-binding transcriptional regulator [Lachnospiraceae bacterium oral taxon 082]|nr:LacI family DNA-binding transcriptional regulator [Lachnospiraceae bacterium oral taxon 082]